MTALGVGELRYTTAGGDNEICWRSPADFAEVSQDQVSVLAQTAEDAAQHRRCPCRSRAAAGRGPPGGQPEERRRRRARLDRDGEIADPVARCQGARYQAGPISRSSPARCRFPAPTTSKGGNMKRRAKTLAAVTATTLGIVACGGAAVHRGEARCDRLAARRGRPLRHLRPAWRGTRRRGDQRRRRRRMSSRSSAEAHEPDRARRAEQPGDRRSGGQGTDRRRRASP